MLPSMGLQRLGHNLVAEQQQQPKMIAVVKKHIFLKLSLTKDY